MNDNERYYRWLYYYSGTVETLDRRRLHAEYVQRQYDRAYKP